MYVTHTCVRTCVRCSVTRLYIIIFYNIITYYNFFSILRNFDKSRRTSTGKRSKKAKSLRTFWEHFNVCYGNLSKRAFEKKKKEKKGVLLFENRVLTVVVKFFRKTVVTLLRTTQIRASRRWRVGYVRQAHTSHYRVLTRVSCLIW